MPSHTTDSWDYDAEKFRELIVLIADRCADDASFGDVYLNKVLFFSDALAVQNFGKPITGARYQKLPMGPAARALLPARRQLVEERAVAVDKVGDRTVTRALRKPAPIFSEDEIELIDEVIKVFHGMWAMHISDVSHRVSPGWNLVEMREDIPLESQMISTSPPSKAALEHGRGLAKRFGW